MKNFAEQLNELSKRPDFRLSGKYLYYRDEVVAFSPWEDAESAPIEEWAIDVMAERTPIVLKSGGKKNAKQLILEAQGHTF